MSDRTTVTAVRAIGGSSGVILPKDMLDHMGIERGQRLIAAPVPGGILLVPEDSAKGEIVASALAFMTKHDAAFRRLALR